MSIFIIIKPGDEDFYADARHERKPHGVIRTDKGEVATTLACPHCGGHFVSRKGSGEHRTFCRECMAVTCGKPTCVRHEMHFMKKIELMEKRCTQRR